jgi:drug/metabolite transporter (DMT)-like permease
MQTNEKTPLVGDEESPSNGYQGNPPSQDHTQPLSLDDEAVKPPCSRVPQGYVFLALVAFLYGTLNVSFRLVYALPDPPAASALSAVRGWLSFICFVPFLAGRRKNTTVPVSPPRHLWKVAAELALWNCGAQGLLTLGLLSTPSARASFLTQTSVVVTPVISAIAGHHVHGNVKSGCVVALVGLMLLSSNNKFGIAFSFGDVLVLAGALCWSLYLFRLSAIGNLYDEVQLQASKNFFMAFFYGLWWLVAASHSEESLWLGWTNWVAWALIFYSALGPGCIADLMQQKGQATVSASVANIVLSMEPVFTAILGRVLLGELTSWQEKLGGGMIILASLVATRT